MSLFLLDMLALAVYYTHINRQHEESNMPAKFAELMYNVFNNIQKALMRVFNIEQGDE